MGSGKKLLTIIAVLLVVLPCSRCCFFYLSERSSYQKNMAESNEIMASQMASVYELYMQNVKEIAHDTAFNNQELFHLSAGERQDPQAKTKILDMLGSISVMNPYVHSAYLYYEEEEWCTALSPCHIPSLHWKILATKWF